MKCEVLLWKYDHYLERWDWSEDYMWVDIYPGVVYNEYGGKDGDIRIIGEGINGLYYITHVMFRNKSDEEKIKKMLIIQEIIK
jgi:hypothetical protein